MNARMILLFLLLATSVMAERSWKTGEVLARVDALPLDVAEFADRHGVAAAQPLSAHWILLKLQGETVPMACERLAAEFAAVQPNYLYAPRDTPNDALLGQQYAVDLLRLEDAWDITLGPAEGGLGGVIAVIDNGVDHTHVDLSGSMWDGSFCVDESANPLDECVHGYDFVDDDKDPAPTEGHGTHVAGVIAATSNNGQGISGVTRRAKIMALRTDLSTAQIVRAIGFASANYAQIINLSWGFGATTCAAAFDQSLYDAIANFDGLVVIAAGDNDEEHDLSSWFDIADFGHDTDCWSALPNVISVTATDANDARGANADYGAGVDIAAPGIAIQSTEPGDAYGNRSGSSIAAAHVAGAASLLWGFLPDLGGGDLRSFLLAGADDITTDQGAMKRLNPYVAIARLAQPQVANLAIFTDSGQQTAIPGGASTSVRAPYFRWDAPTGQGVIANYLVSSSLGSFSTTDTYFDAAARGLNFDVGEHELYVSAHNDAGGTADALHTFFTVTAPTVNFVDSSIDRVESETVIIQVQLSEPASAAASITVALRVDEEAFMTEILSWSIGESGLKTFSFNLDDDLVQGDRSIIGSLTNPVNVHVGEEPEIGFQLYDDDPRVGVNILDARAPENAFLIFDFQLTEPAEVPVSFDFQLTAESATAGADYTDAPTTIHLNAGKSSGTVVVPAIDDDLMEGPETLSITLINLSGVQPELSDVFATGTIVDNDIIIDLAAGWNLVGSPLLPDGARSGLLQDGEIAWYWDAEGRRYRRGDLSRAKAGHWVYAPSARQIVATGSEQPAPTARSGWNLITPLAPQLATVYSLGWDGSAFTRAPQLELGQGYWILLLAD